MALAGENGEPDVQVREIEAENKRLKELVADLSIENHLLKKKSVITGYCTHGDYTKVPAEEKLDIIRFVQAAPWSVKRALAALGLARSTFYDWLSRYRQNGFRGLVGMPRPPIIPENKLYLRGSRKRAMQAPSCRDRWCMTDLQRVTVRGRGTTVTFVRFPARGRGNGAALMDLYAKPDGSYIYAVLLYSKIVSVSCMEEIVSADRTRGIKADDPVWEGSFCGRSLRRVQGLGRGTASSPGNDKSRPDSGADGSGLALSAST